MSNPSVDPRKIQRGFEFVRNIPFSLYSEAIAKKNLKLGPLKTIGEDVPKGWHPILQAEDPREAIRTAFSSSLGDKIADAVTHVSLLSSKKGPRLVYIFVVPVYATELKVHMLFGTPPAEDPRADKYADLAQLLRMHGSLMDAEKHGVWHPKDWRNNAGAKLDVGDDEGFPKGYRVPYELIRMARPFSADEDDKDAALGYDPKSDIPRAYRVVDGSLEVTCDVVSDLECQLEEWVGAWDTRVDFCHRVVKLERKAKKFKKPKDVLSKLTDGDLFIATDGDSYLATIKLGDDSYVGFSAYSEEDALLGLQLCPLAVQEKSSEDQDLNDILEDLTHVKLGRVELISRLGPFPALPQGLPVGSTATLRTLIDKGGKIAIPAGEYHLEAPLVISNAVELDGSGQVLLVSEGPAALAFEAEGRSAVRGLAIDAKAGTGVAVSRGEVSVEQSIFVGQKVDDENHRGVTATKAGKVSVLKTAIRGFWIGVEINDDASGSVVDCRIEHTALGVGSSDGASLTVADTETAFQSGACYAANNKSQLTIAASGAYRSSEYALYASDEATLVIHGSELLGSGAICAYALDKARLEIGESVVEGGWSSGVAAWNEAQVRIRASSIRRVEKAIFVGSSARVELESVAIEGCVENGVVSRSNARPFSVDASRVVVRRTGWPAFAAVLADDQTAGSVLRLRNCTTSDCYEALLAEGKGCRVEAANCVFALGNNGARSFSGAHVALADCTLKEMEGPIILFKEQGTWEESGTILESSPFGPAEGTDEEDDSDDDGDNDDEDEDSDDAAEEPPRVRADRERLGEVSVPSGILAITDFSTLEGWNEKKDGAKLRRLLNASNNKVACEIAHGSGIVQAIRVPAGNYQVWGSRMGEGGFAGNWSVVDLDLAPTESVANCECIGSLYVDGARFMFADAKLLDEWKADKLIDNLLDLCFWGMTDPEAVCAATGAKPLGMHCGWTDLTQSEAKARMTQLKKVTKANGWRVVSEVNRHDQHNRMLRQLHQDLGKAATIEVEALKVCGMFTDWGDGVFPIWLETGENGQPVRVRVYLGTKDTVETAREINDMGDDDDPDSEEAS